MNFALKESPFVDARLIERIVEAAVLAAPQPLSVAQLYGLFPEDEPAPRGSIEQALLALQEQCAERGVQLVEVGSGWRYQVRGDVHAWVTRLWTERHTRYTRATLETLSLIAYRQPITRGEIEQIRGVAVNTNIIRMLEEREWIRVVGHRDVPGRPALFGTTRAFLDYFNLKSLDELPPLAELQDIAELEPELPFGQPMTASAAMPEDSGSDTEPSSTVATAVEVAETPERPVATTDASAHVDDNAGTHDQPADAPMQNTP